MLYLTLRTDAPQAQIELYEGSTLLVQHQWFAHYELAETIHTVINETLSSQSKSLHDINGVGVFRGPGSFTGLRIGIAVANALASGLGVAIVGATGESWSSECIARLQNSENDKLVSPYYGADPHITKAKK